MTPLIVFSHLRWNFVYQRPQHLMTRLARHYEVLFLEEPCRDQGSPRWEIQSIAEHLRVFRPYTPVEASGFHDEQLSPLRALLQELVLTQQIERPIVWFYTPMALPLLRGLEPRLVVYDCMDELAAFRNAPRQLLQREHALLKICDLVFTGGPSLYRAKRQRHPAVHCFPSSVEREHFAQARDPKIEHAQQSGLARPRLGFFGVLDERLDVELVDALARAHPQWQIVMVGPLVKIEAGILPRATNIHYFGAQTYADLPRFLAGWDLCLLPFARNEATRFISPTKTLEYMAADKPIVSTPVTDVVEPYAEVVAIGEGEEFIAQCAAALAETPAARAQRSARMRAMVERTSWDRTAEGMRALIESCGGQSARLEAARRAAAVPAGAAAGATGAAGARTGEERSPPIIVIGAGPTGLSAAYHLGEQCLLLEQHERVGGWCRSVQERGFTFDYAGHIMFSNDPYVHQLYAKLLGDNVHWQHREAWIRSNGVYTRYPFQGALYGLPPAVIAECIIGAIEARVGALQEPGAPPGPHGAAGNGAAGSGAAGSGATACKAESITDCCADGIAESTAPLARSIRAAAPSEGGGALSSAGAAGAPRNFEEFIYKVWGKGIARHFAVPYNRKLWAVPLASMETSWLGGRVPLPDLKEMIEGALQPVAKPMGPNARFGYPLRGGFQALMDGFLARLKGPLELGARVVRIVPSRHRLVLANGTVHGYERLISTMPLPLLVKAAGEEAPPAVRLAASRLKHVSVRCVNLGIGREKLTEKHWIYYPDPRIVFHRIFVQGNASPHCNPRGGFGLTCEITYSPDKPLPCDGEALTERCIADCIEVGMLRPDDRILLRHQLDMPYAYVVYDHARAEHVRVIRAWAEEHDIVLAGRYSEWQYYNSDHAFLAGRDAAAEALAGLRSRAAGDELLEYAACEGAAREPAGRGVRESGLSEAAASRSSGTAPSERLRVGP